METRRGEHEVRKPSRAAFVTFGILKSVGGSLVLLVLVYLALLLFPKVPMLIVLGVLGGLSLLQLISQVVILPIQFNKEEYVLQKDRLISRGGSLLSSYEQELLVKNITHVELELPFIEHKLYGTGTLHIQAAGGNDVEIHMRALENPEAMYNQLLALLEENGFSVSCVSQVEADKPNITGVWLETCGSGAVALAVGSWIVGTANGMAQDPKLAELFQMGWSFGVLLVLAALAVVGGLVMVHGRAKHREYKMFEDAITSETDFLGIKRAIIPMKNLSDSTLDQGVIGRLLDIHHVSLSCQGSGHEILFKHVTAGQRWKESLDGLLKAQAEERTAAKAAQRDAAKEVPGFHEKPVFAADREESFTASFKMDKRYLYIPVLIMLVVAVVFLAGGGALAFTQGADLPKGEPPPPGLIAGLVLLGIGGLAMLLAMLRGFGGVVVYFANTFRILPTGFEQDFQFIKKRNVVFNADKVTGIIVKQGIFDRLLGTGSVEFWSIGASDHLRFSNIRLEEELLDKIKAKVAIHPKEKSQSFLTEASLMDTWKANIFFYVFLLLTTPVLAVLAPIGLVAVAAVFVLPFVFTHIYYKFHHLELYDDSLWFRKGIFFRTSYFIRYEDIKYISGTKYPLTDTGTLTFDVAGERVIESDNGQHRVSNRFHVRYIPELPYHQLAADMLLTQKIELEKVPSLKGSLQNYAPQEQLGARPHMLQMLLTRGLALLVLDALLVGGAGYLLMGGGLSAHDLEQLKAMRGVSLLLAWGLPVLIAFNLVAFVLLTMYIRSISYSIDEQKVVKRWGLFYKKNLGIHFADIDYIGKQQGAINKLFSTGNVTVNTVGSSETDLTLSALPGANTFYQTLKQHYRPEEAE